MVKYRCKICGEVFEVPEGVEPVCPKCGMKGSFLEKLETTQVSKYQGTQTEKNLQAAFAGESQARNKYTYFASVAKKEGYEQILHCLKKQQTMKKSTQKCGSKNLMGLAIQLKT